VGPEGSHATHKAGNQNFVLIGTSAGTVVDQWRYGLDLPTNLTMFEGHVTGSSGAAFQSALTGL